MILKIQKNMKKVAFILAFFMLLMSADLVLLSAEEGEEEYRSCGEALELCLKDALKLFILAPIGALICLGGWAFCKKYVEKHLPKI